MFDLDWTNYLYYSPVALPNLCRRQPWLANMDQSTLMPAAISRPGLSQPQHIIAAGVIINTVLETRNRPFDSCVTLAVDVGTERRPYWASQRWEHLVMGHIKASMRKPATDEQAARMYPGDSDAIKDKN